MADQVQGYVVARGIATRPDHLSVPYRVVSPFYTPQNADIISKERDRWAQTLERFRTLERSRQIDYFVMKRAEFGVSVMSTVAENVRNKVCCEIILQDYQGRILGVATYGFLDAQEGALNLEVIDPEHLAGTPGTMQLRGIGTALVAVVARAMLITNHTTIYLHPLDDTAGQFWQSRGFRVCGGGGLMCIRGREGILKLRQSCESIPDCPSDGDCLICGFPKEPLAS